jgi:hypothetical protein
MVRDGIAYFGTHSEAIAAAHQCMDLIKRLKPWTGPWERSDVGYEFYNFPKDYLPVWEATDGVITWEIEVNVSYSLDLFDVLVVMWGEDQMQYNWSVPSDGTVDQVIRCCLAARQVDVDQGEQWRWLNCLDIQDGQFVQRTWRR